MSTPQAPQRTVGKAAVSYQVIQVGVARNPVVEPRPPRILCQGEAARYIRKKQKAAREGGQVGWGEHTCCNAFLSSMAKGNDQLCVSVLIARACAGVYTNIGCMSCGYEMGHGTRR